MTVEDAERRLRKLEKGRARHREPPEPLERYRRLEAFLAGAWHVLEPGRALKTGPLISAICEHLEAVTAGQIPRLLMNVPPGCAKSIITSVIWPAWEWGPMGLSHLRMIGWSHNFGLSMRDSRRMKLLIESVWFQERWPMAIAEDQAAKSRFENLDRGWRMAASVGGIGTGERADRNIVDDPHQIADANSPAALEEARLWWRETLPLRVNDPSESALVVIMQRVHEKDISGLIGRHPEGWCHLMLPMEYEPARRCVTSIGFADWRSHEGELLFPERYPAAEVERLKAELGSYAVASQFQQRPAPRQGGMFKVDKLAIVDDWPKGALQVRRWDFAATVPSAGRDPDWTAGVRLAWHKGQCWIVDIRRDRLTPLGVQTLVRRTAEIDTDAVPILLEQEPGSSGVTVLDHYRREVLAGFATRASKVTGSKIQRADPFAAAVEAGNVLLVRGAWNEAFIDELRTFPGGSHDDQVDAAADGFSWVAKEARWREHNGGAGIFVMPVQAGDPLGGYSLGERFEPVSLRAFGGLH